MISPHEPAAAPSAGSIKEKRRQQLVEAAFNLIAEHGFEGSRTRDVAAEVGANIAGSVLGAKDILEDPAAPAERRPVFELVRR